MVTRAARRGEPRRFLAIVAVHTGDGHAVDPRRRARVRLADVAAADDADLDRHGTLRSV